MSSLFIPASDKYKAMLTIFSCSVNSASRWPTVSPRFYRDSVAQPRRSAPSVSTPVVTPVQQLLLPAQERQLAVQEPLPLAQSQSAVVLHQEPQPRSSVHFDPLTQVVVYEPQRAVSTMVCAAATVSSPEQELVEFLAPAANDVVVVQPEAAVTGPEEPAPLTPEQLYLYRFVAPFEEFSRFLARQEEANWIQDMKNRFKLPVSAVVSLRKPVETRVQLLVPDPAPQQARQVLPQGQSTGQQLIARPTEDVQMGGVTKPATERVVEQPSLVLPVRSQPVPKQGTQPAQQGSQPTQRRNALVVPVLAQPVPKQATQPAQQGSRPTQRRDELVVPVLSQPVPKQAAQPAQQGQLPTQRRDAVVAGQKDQKPAVRSVPQALRQPTPMPPASLPARQDLPATWESDLSAALAAMKGLGRRYMEEPGRELVIQPVKQPPQPARQPAQTERPPAQPARGLFEKARLSKMEEEERFWKEEEDREMATALAESRAMGPRVGEYPKLVPKQASQLAQPGLLAAPRKDDGRVGQPGLQSLGRPALQSLGRPVLMPPSQPAQPGRQPAKQTNEPSVGQKGKWPVQPRSPLQSQPTLQACESLVGNKGKGPAQPRSPLPTKPTPQVCVAPVENKEKGPVQPRSSLSTKPTSQANVPPVDDKGKQPVQLRSPFPTAQACSPLRPIKHKKQQATERPKPAEPTAPRLPSVPVPAQPAKPLQPTSTVPPQPSRLLPTATPVPSQLVQPPLPAKAPKPQPKPTVELTLPDAPTLTFPDAPVAQAPQRKVEALQASTPAQPPKKLYTPPKYTASPLRPIKHKPKKPQQPKPAEAPKPAEPAQPGKAIVPPKPTEPSQPPKPVAPKPPKPIAPTMPSKPAEPAQPSRPAAQAKSAAPPKTVEPPKPVQTPKPAEIPKPAATPERVPTPFPPQSQFQMPGQFSFAFQAPAATPCPVQRRPASSRANKRPPPVVRLPQRTPADVLRTTAAVRQALQNQSAPDDATMAGVQTEEFAVRLPEEMKYTPSDTIPSYTSYTGSQVQDIVISLAHAASGYHWSKSEAADEGEAWRIAIEKDIKDELIEGGKRLNHEQAVNYVQDWIIRAANRNLPESADKDALIKYLRGRASLKGMGAVY